jgi:hypothetical protein
MSECFVLHATLNTMLGEDVADEHAKGTHTMLLAGKAGPPAGCSQMVARSLYWPCGQVCRSHTGRSTQAAGTGMHLHRQKKRCIKQVTRQQRIGASSCNIYACSPAYGS